MQSRRHNHNINTECSFREFSDITDRSFNSSNKSYKSNKHYEKKSYINHKRKRRRNYNNMNILSSSALSSSSTLPIYNQPNKSINPNTTNFDDANSDMINSNICDYTSNPDTCVNTFTELNTCTNMTDMTNGIDGNTDNISLEVGSDKEVKEDIVKIVKIIKSLDNDIRYLKKDVESKFSEPTPILADDFDQKIDDQIKEYITFEISKRFDLLAKSLQYKINRINEKLDALRKSNPNSKTI